MDPQQPKFDENEIKAKIDKDLKNMSILKEMFAKFAKIENDSSNAKQTALNLINTVVEENTFLKDVNNNFLSALSEIEKGKKSLIETINNTLVEAASFYPEKFKEQKLKIANLKDLKKQKEKTLNEINKAKTKNETETINKLHMQLNEKLANEAKDIKILEEQVIKNEADRLTDQKYLLLHYVHAALAYHCTSMQVLTKLFTTVNATDPREGLNAFIKSYKITTYRDEELPKMFNYVVGNTQRKLDALKNSNIPPVSGIQNDNNLVNNMNMNNQKINMVASPPNKNLNMNMLMDNDNILANNNNVNNFNQPGKNPPGWLPQNSMGNIGNIANMGVSGQPGFNRGPGAMPRNTLTSSNIMINNK